MFPPSSLLPTFIPFTSAHKVFHWSRELEIKYKRVASENMFRSSRDLCPKLGACLISFTARKFAAGVLGKMLSFKLLFDLLLLRGQWNFSCIKENSAVERAMVEDVPTRLRLFLDRPRASLAQIKSNFSKAQSRCLPQPFIRKCLKTVLRRQPSGCNRSENIYATPRSAREQLQVLN